MVGIADRKQLSYALREIYMQLSKLQTLMK